jgi:hypothetical protein
MSNGLVASTTQDVPGQMSYVHGLAPLDFTGEIVLVLFDGLDQDEYC